MLLIMLYGKYCVIMQRIAMSASVLLINTNEGNTDLQCAFMPYFVMIILQSEHSQSFESLTALLACSAALRT